MIYNIFCIDNIHIIFYNKYSDFIVWVITS